MIGATIATSVAAIKLASTPRDRRLALRRTLSDTRPVSAQAKTSCSKKLYAMSIHTNSPA